VPSAFTSGNDGRNDVLKAVPVGIKKFKSFIVYNRWGSQVFYTTDPNKGWDGKLHGIIQSTGVYVWTAEGIDVKGKVIKRKGTVTLIQ
jgi:gliding motility-associated-like protein